MAANLNKTKRRIASINSTKKITKAMELVATVKLKRYKDVMLANGEYTSQMVHLMATLFSKLDEDESSVYLSEKKAPKDLIIVINSNLGLCASYNNDVYRFVEANISKNDSIIMPIGIKGDDYYKKNGYELYERFVNVNERIDYEEIVKLSRLIHNDFILSKFKSIKLVYTHYVNSIKFVPEIISIFPLQKLEAEESNAFPPLFDPNVKTLIEELVPIYTSSLLYHRIIESQVCEQGARRSAMENATDNADELIEELTLVYNKARQTAITQEITEVISGQQN